MARAAVWPAPTALPIHCNTITRICIVQHSTHSLPRPYKQGRLDGLCGLYACINAFSYSRKLTLPGCRDDRTNEARYAHSLTTTQDLTSERQRRMYADGIKPGS